MSKQTSVAPAIVQRIKESFAAQGLMRHLGAELAELQPGKASIRLPYREELTQHMGFFHAGATSAIADAAGGYAGITLFPQGSSILTVEYKLNLVAPAKGEWLEAVAKVIRSGRTLTVCQLEVFAVQDEDKTLVAVGQQTLIRVEDS